MAPDGAQALSAAAWLVSSDAANGGARPARPPAGMRREHAVVEHEVNPRPWSQRGQLLEQRERLEHELARAVRPRGLEREHDAAIGQEAPSNSTDTLASLSAHRAAWRLEAGVVGDVEQLRQVGVLVAAEGRVDHVVGENTSLLGLVSDPAHGTLRQRACSGTLRGHVRRNRSPSEHFEGRHDFAVAPRAFGGLGVPVARPPVLVRFAYVRKIRTTSLLAALMIALTQALAASA